MESANRRQFLGRTLLAGVGATLVQPFTGTGALAATAADPQDEVDPNFVMGQVVEVSEDGRVAVLDLDTAYGRSR